MDRTASRRVVIMAALLLLFSVGTVQAMARLPAWWWIAGMLPMVLILARRWPLLRWLALGLAGAAWASWRASSAMEARLPYALEHADLLVRGEVNGLPRRQDDGLGLDFRIRQAYFAGHAIAWRGQARLVWYRQLPKVLPPCSQWQLLVRLKRPRGLLNPGGRDSERAALEHGIDAVGYVRAGPLNRLQAQHAWCIDRLRDRVAQAIDKRVANLRDAALLKAFAVGDTRGLSQDDWEVARANGIPHLIAISGFHIGIAALFGAALAQLAYLVWPGLALHLPRPQAAAGASLMTAWGYGVLAGMSLPTVRTLLMITTWVLARCCRRAGNGAHALALALIVMLVVDPLAVLSAGFWLSFVGVSFLMLCLVRHGRSWRAVAYELFAGQWLMTCALLPLSQRFFGEASLVGALSNLIAVPVVSFLIVPLVLTAMLCLWLMPLVATPLWHLAAWITHIQWWLLRQMAQWPGAHWYLPQVKMVALLLAVLGAGWLFIPRGLPLRGLGLLLFLPLLWPPLPSMPVGAVQLWVLDVGQGLSVLLRTRHHTLLYDAGARYRSGFDMGQAVVLPTLHALGIHRLDILMISHADNDHAGGAMVVAQAFPQAKRYAGEPARMALPMQSCQFGQVWQWDGVSFKVLSPRGDNGRGNSRSCVLLVQAMRGRVLLTGDIDAQVEARVVGDLSGNTPLVLVVPHHGSRGSSSQTLLAAAKPVLAVVSTGWHNRFGHPHPLVVQRYHKAGVPLFNTAVDGAVRIDVAPRGAPEVVELARRSHRAYWRE